MLRRIQYLSMLTILGFILIGCKSQTYSILFVSNGGSIVSTIKEIADTPIVEPDEPTKVGYTFAGWFSDANCNSEYNFNFMPSYNLTLYAKWLINDYTITFDSNGGESFEPITFTYNSEITLPSPKKDNMIFVGWFSDFSLTKFFNNINMPANSFTLYAKWTDDDTIKDKELYRVDINQSIQEALDAYYGGKGIFNVLPSKGDVNILVIPIQFPNDKFTLLELNRVNYGFFGDGSRYETLKSYYHKSSYGALNLDGKVLTPYTAKQNYEYYDKYNSKRNAEASGVDLLIEELIFYYSANYPNLDLSIFDSEGDFTIDGVYLVYSAPIEYHLNNSIYWAFQYYYNPTRGSSSDYYLNWGDYSFNAYVFSGVDFFYENRQENAWTIIHETGHLLGLEDYYDYTENLDNNIGGLGQSDMMDNNLGDHNSFSKLLLDWIDPIIITKTTTIKIDKYETSGDAVIISNEFNNIFGEYFIMHYYTPTGFNQELVALNQSGLLIYDVRANLPYNYDSLSDYSYYFLNNNSDTTNKLINIVEADGRNDISKGNGIANNADLLQKGNRLTLRRYDQFVCDIYVVEQTEDSITLTFTFY